MGCEHRRAFLFKGEPFQKGRGVVEVHKTERDVVHGAMERKEGFRERRKGSIAATA